MRYATLICHHVYGAMLRAMPFGALPARYAMAPLRCYDCCRLYAATLDASLMPPFDAAFHAIASYQPDMILFLRMILIFLHLIPPPAAERRFAAVLFDDVSIFA